MRERVKRDGAGRRRALEEKIASIHIGSCIRNLSQSGVVALEITHPL